VEYPKEALKMATRTDQEMATDILVAWLGKNACGGEYEELAKNLGDMFRMLVKAIRETDRPQSPQSREAH